MAGIQRGTVGAQRAEAAAAVRGQVGHTEPVQQWGLRYGWGPAPPPAFLFALRQREGLG